MLETDAREQARELARKTGEPYLVWRQIKDYINGSNETVKDPDKAYYNWFARYFSGTSGVWELVVVYDRNGNEIPMPKNWKEDVES